MNDEETSEVVKPLLELKTPVNPVPKDSFCETDCEPSPIEISLKTKGLLLSSCCK